MDSIKNVYNIIKKGLHNQRYRALTILALYFIFFALVISWVRNTNTYQPTEPIIELTTIEKFAQKDTYSYIYTFNNNNIVGKSYKNKLQFTYVKDYYYDGTLYEKIDDNYYISNDELDLYYELTPLKIKQLVENSIINQQTQNYIDQTISTSYLVNDSMFESEVVITLVETTSEIVKVEIELNEEKITISYQYDIVEPFVVTIGE